MLDDGWDPTAEDKIWTDGDGDVDLDDLSLLDDNWAPAGYLPEGAAGNPTTVPEPGSPALLGMVGVSLLAYAWRRHRRR